MRAGDSLAYLIDGSELGTGAIIIDDAVRQVVGVQEPPLLVFVGNLSMLAIGATGIAWQTPAWPSMTSESSGYRRTGSSARARTLGGAPASFSIPPPADRQPALGPTLFGRPGASM